MEKILITIICDGCGKEEKFDSIFTGPLVGREHWIEMKLPPARHAHACSKDCAIKVIQDHKITRSD